ncbi:MAG: helix-turn-helix domain-containing protein, partial [Bryobacteraceae bacterium]|nr:helix-turn-helix domain-containing protein [Bryobacteraceae bacterium]
MKRDKSIAEIASDTRISSRYLQAIEADDVKQLPGDFFYKAFLRQYAKSLELDLATTEQIISLAIHIEEPDLLPVLNEVYANARTGASSRWTPPTVVAAGLLVFVLACGSGLYAWLQRAQTQQEAADLASVTREAEPTPAPTTVTPLPAPPESNAVVPSGPNDSQVAPPDANATANSGSMTVELASKEPAWVSFSSGGKTLYIGTLEPTQPRQFSVTEDSKLL